MEATSKPVMPQAQTENRKKSEKNKLQCGKYCALYRSKFRDIPYISSVEFLDMCQKGESATLVDVRTDLEQATSVIEGALTKEQFHRQAPGSSQDDAFDDNDTTPIITYCTIGYRSGLEARRLGLLYPHLKERIYSLDGIVAYTHALGAALKQDDRNIQFGVGPKRDNATIIRQGSSADSEECSRPRLLVKPYTGEPTNEVHTFGWVWSVAAQNFQPTHFTIPFLIPRLLEVMVAIITCFLLRIRHYCLPPAGARQQLVQKVE